MIPHGEMGNSQELVANMWVFSGYRSCLLHRFVKNEWRVLSSQTIGVEFATKIIKVGTGARRKRIKLQVGEEHGQVGSVQGDKHD